MTQSQYINDFFKTYSKFLSKELYRAMRPNGTLQSTEGIVINYYGGRPSQYLANFVRTFYTIIDFNDKDEKLNNITRYNKKLIDVYLNKIKNPLSINLEGEKLTENALFCEAIKDKKFVYTLELYYEAFYRFLNHAKNNQFLKHTVTSKHSALFLQPTIEFYNALSHLYIAYSNEKETDIHSNINKALSHIHRGTLDYYKKLIKFVDLDTADQEKLVDLRKKEFLSIGINTNDDTKINIIENYAKFVFTLLTKFPNNALKTSK